MKVASDLSHEATHRRQGSAKLRWTAELADDYYFSRALWKYTCKNHTVGDDWNNNLSRSHLR